ncbi:hypothetical protein NPIL_677681 [Nephila pilipes]|uniref:Uncharacterized protein n=1 Tax=Nephila pilipes TaxID=299642 RepID=A0A8X6PHQ6_NEPPI|nr:hypothetical protein NPIL_677681 [Nephila pilipes]
MRNACKPKPVGLNWFKWAKNVTSSILRRLSSSSLTTAFTLPEMMYGMEHGEREAGNEKVVNWFGSKAISSLVLQRSNTFALNRAFFPSVLEKPIFQSHCCLSALTVRISSLRSTRTTPLGVSNIFENSPYCS